MAAARSTIPVNRASIIFGETADRFRYRTVTVPMMIIKNYVAPSPIHGVGVFAGEDIAQGTCIYRFVEGVDIVMTRDQTFAYGDEFARFMKIFAYVDPADRTMVISVDNSRFMNHAQQPNTSWDEECGWATRDIRKGEELTCDYYTFWFEPPFADPKR